MSSDVAIQGGFVQLRTSNADTIVFRGGALENTVIRPYSSSHNIQLAPDGGTVGIGGDTTPDYNLEVGGTFAVSSTASANADRFLVESDGNVGIGDSTPGQKLEITSVMRLTPTDSPGACTASQEGSLYYDDSLGELCDCDGSSWAQVDGGGAC